ncbi:hypothetical protein BCD67_14380 [Oscillatoriales cyanobacterium USR001]|nr:hypothetical protein BCD67_14380 [Oscillatoriales cyanobacterium USR001]
MNPCKAFFATAATLSVLMVSTAAQAVTVTLRSDLTDDGFRSLLTNGDFSESFVAESRMGRPRADRQVGINSPIVPNGNGGFTGGNPFSQGTTQGFTTWEKGKAVQFSLEYTGSVINYIVNNVTLSTTAVTGAVNGMFIRTFAGATGSTSSLTNLVLQGFGGIPDLTSNASTNKVNYLQISGITAPFKITGESTFNWTGTQPTGSNIAYQIKAGNFSEPSPEPVPEPITMVGMGLGLSGLAAARSRRKEQKVS